MSQKRALANLKISIDNTAGSLNNGIALYSYMKQKLFTQE